jgi:AcrR family transcriptional regulator
MSSGKTLTARDRIMKVAEDLFYREGVRAVGIDRIIEESGVAKMSLYRSFASKDELVATYLKERSERHWRWWDTVMALHPGQPEQQLHDLFEAVAERVNSPGFRGCAFANAATEFPEEGSRARAVALAHKAARHERIVTLCEGAGAENPSVLADQLSVLLEGTYAIAGCLGGRNVADSAAKAAAILIAAAIRRDSAALASA